jgi:hypothetical protein
MFWFILGANPHELKLLSSQRENSTVRERERERELMMIKFTTVTNANGNKSVKFVLLNSASG